MIDYFALTGVALGLGSILLLLLIAWIKKKQFPQLSDGVVVFLSGAGIGAGIKVCKISLTPGLLQGLENERSYVFLAGLAVVWVSVESIWKAALRLEEPTKASVAARVDEKRASGTVGSTGT
jgi:hypothetical protein